MRIKKGILKSLAENTGLPVSKLSDYAAGRIRPGRDRAIFLGDESGVDAATWMFGSPTDIKSALNGQSLNRDCP